jgi:hypothetical protein
MTGDFPIIANKAVVHDIMPLREGNGYEVRVNLRLSVEQTQQLLAMLGEQRYVRCTLSEAI